MTSCGVTPTPTHPPGTLPKETRRDLRAIFADGIAFSLMVGLGETYVPAFALALGLSELTAGWIVSTNFYWLLGMQVLSGSIWAVYELCTFLLLFDHIEERERTSVLTTFNLANATALVGGALGGGLLLHALGAGREAYLVLFGLSSLARCVSIVFLFRLRKVTFRPAEIAMRTLAVRPNTGSIDAPIVAGLEENAESSPRRAEDEPGE